MYCSRKKIIHCCRIAVFLVASTSAIACSKRQAEDAPKSNAGQPAEGSSRSNEQKSIDALIDKAYDLKNKGKNGDALALFVTIQKKIVALHGKASEPYASNLDDLGTCYLRGGNYKEARRLYNEALGILEAQNRTDSRLYAAVHRRLRTMDRFETVGVRCAEPLSPQTDEPVDSSRADGDAGVVDALPFFPANEALYSVFYKINGEIKGCVKTHGKPIPVWNVVTGDGRVVMSSVKAQNLPKDEAKCIEDKLLSIAPKYRDRLPRFRACYRNYTFPMVFSE